MLSNALQRNPVEVPPHWKAGKLTRRHYPRLIRNFYQPIISKLISERKRQGLTQMDVNEIVGCTDSLIAKWESGNKLPSLYFLLLWIEALELDLRLEGEDEQAGS
jgi:DNA-binding XRE family transcriptional regulator